MNEIVQIGMWNIPDQNGIFSAPEPGIRVPIAYWRNMTMIWLLHKVSVKDDPVKKSGHPETVVGQTSENVEANRAGEGVNDASYLIADFSSSVYHPASCAARSEAQQRVSSTTSPLAIKTEVEIKQESELTHDMEATFYGTYDEATNSITIIYPGEENAGIGIQECVQEISTDDGVVCHPVDDIAAAATAAAAATTTTNSTTTSTTTTTTSTTTTPPPTSPTTTTPPPTSPTTITGTTDVTSNVRYLSPPPIHSYSTQFSPAYTCRTDTMSPASINSDADSCVVPQMDSASMDCGYESHDSPSVDSHCRYSYFNDFWHENFRELFPALA
ncbi:hypothetical protein EAI_09735 [Harpegnathos saltator]|uniref:Uncharacterized protein n=1 Tax=Harpegnathos saltator TaxID=610380 RepID=E2C8K3_HARSA|nr:hypothetical protein EAI_09735 [Harpegnathos saltator]